MPLLAASSETDGADITAVHIADTPTTQEVDTPTNHEADQSSTQPYHRLQETGINSSSVLITEHEYIDLQFPILKIKQIHLLVFS